MYVTLLGITNGQSIQLLHTIDNSAGQLEFALCDVTYYPWWTNISTARDNNEIILIDNDNRKNTPIIIPDGYYSVCSLNDEFFKPLGVIITQNDSNGMLIFNAGEKVVVIRWSLAYTLGLVNYEGGRVILIPTKHRMELNYPI